VQSTPSYALFLVAGLALLAPVHAQVCGNGIREGNEQCDDGNRASFDGCSARCTFEQTQRINHLALQGATSTVCTTNALGGAFTGLALSQLQSAIDASVGDGTTSLLLYFTALSDLSGTADANFRAGLFNAMPLSPNGNYNGNNDVDWWYAVDDTEMDAMQTPLSELSGNIAAKVLTAQGSSFELMTVLGTTITMSTSALKFSVTTGTSSVPLTYNGVDDRGHLATENLDPLLQSFSSAGDGTTGSLCGNVNAQSLANTPISAGILTSCTSYTAANSVLDLLVGGCTYSGIVQLVKATQPDSANPGAPVAGAGAPYTLTTSASKVVTGCTDKNSSAVPLSTCLNAAAYSFFFKFSTDRVIAKSASASDFIFYDGFQ